MFGCGVHWNWKINRSTSTRNTVILVCSAREIENIQCHFDRSKQSIPFAADTYLSDRKTESSSPTREHIRLHAAKDHACCCFEGRLQGMDSPCCCFNDPASSCNISSILTHHSRSPSKTAHIRTSKSPPMRSSRSPQQLFAAATCISTEVT